MTAAVEKRFKIAKLMICLPIGLVLAGCSKVQHHVFIAENVVVSGTADDSMALQKNMPFLSQKCSEVSDGFGLQLDQLLKAGWKVTSSQPHTHPGLQVVLPIGGPATIGCVGTSYIIERSEWFWNDWSFSKPQQPASAPPARSITQPIAPAVSRQRATPPKTDLQGAFDVAFGGNPGVGDLTFKPAILVSGISPNTNALVSEGSQPDGCRACSGKLRITYVTRANVSDAFAIANPKVEKDIEGGSWGGAPGWRLSVNSNGINVLTIGEENTGDPKAPLYCTQGSYLLSPGRR